MKALGGFSVLGGQEAFFCSAIRLSTSLIRSDGAISRASHRRKTMRTLGLLRPSSINEM